MLKILNAFRKCQASKSTGAKSLLPCQLRETKLFLAARTGLALGLVCLPLSLGCRSGIPQDWVGQRHAISESWNAQSNYLRGEDASFQEGWRRGYQDGQASAGEVSAEREPAQFEAFMNSKREEAENNWRRGYDSGFTSAVQKSDLHQSHAQLFPGSTGEPNAEPRQPQPQELSDNIQPSPSLFGIQQDQQPKPEHKEWVGANSEPKPAMSPPPTSNLPSQVSILTQTQNSAASVSEFPAPAQVNQQSPQTPSSFENAAELLDSVIKKNGEASVADEGTGNEESLEPSTNIESTEVAPTEPSKTEDAEPTDGSSPNSDRTILDVPLDDDDVAGGVESHLPQRTMSVLENAKNSQLPLPNEGTEIESRPTSRIHSAGVPLAYAGRMQSGLVVANPHASTKNGQHLQPKALAQATDSANHSAGYTQATSGDFAATAPIATQASDEPMLPVNHEAKPEHATDVELAFPSRLPKGLPFRTRSARR